MERKHASYAVRNSFWGVVGQLCTAILSFVTRKVFLNYLSIDYLGISATFTSILQTLSLSELGFQTAIVFFLYKPLVEGDSEVVNRYINYYRKLYIRIALFITLGAIAVSFFIPHYITGIEISAEIYYIYVIHVASVVATYLLSYKRALLYADQKEYISSRTDMIANCIASLLRICVVVIWGNYILYIAITLFQTVFSNLFIEYKCRSLYPYLDRSLKETDEIKSNVWKKIKDILAGRIAGYVYGCTDNLIISRFVSTISVGYISNYTAVKAIVNNLICSITTPILPSVGNYLVVEERKDKAYEMYLNLTYLRAVLATVILAPMASLIQLFIELWIGKEYILPYTTVILIVADLYCSLLMGPNGEFLNASGNFEAERNVAIVGASVNLISSLLLVNFYGVNGVFAGTVLSQIVFWVGRYLTVNKSYFNFSMKQKAEYIQRIIVYSFVFCADITAGVYISKMIKIDNMMFRFIIAGLTVECINVIIDFLILSRFREYDYFKHLVCKIVKNGGRNT